MRSTFLAALLVVCLGACSSPSTAESITLATYNVEHFETHFDAYRLSRTPEGRQATGLLKDLLDAERVQNDEDNWEVAQVITDPAFDPDVLVVQEGCTQSNLEYFNKRWLRSAYATVIVFPSNTDRNQHLGLLLKPGFKVIERRDRYHLEKDPVKKDLTDRLFARGPAFVLVQTPGGYRLWVGVTHQKSKSDNSVDVTQWRNREARRTHEIMRELAKAGSDDVILLGDMNDELGVGEFEAEGGGDTIANLVGPAEHQFVLVTEALAKSGEISFGGYWNPKYRSFIDHVVATPAMKDQIEKAEVFRGSLAASASDHYPVVVKIRSDGANGAAAAVPTSPVASSSPGSKRLVGVISIPRSCTRSRSCSGPARRWRSCRSPRRCRWRCR
jgi:endonuclease/exonuclease/phosphatase family metal-dependent hydrolase